MAQTVLEIKDISKRYPTTDHFHIVLNNLQMSVKEGEFVTILGPSGCGKSTLLNIIAGLDRSNSGTVLINGHTVDSTGPDRIVIFQEGALLPWLTVFENVEFGLRMVQVPKNTRKKIAAHFIEMVQLSRFANSYIYQLSGGMKQRVAIARALALDPKILLMDEPFAALDVQTRELMCEQLLQIHKDTGKTILFVTHNINEALLLADRVIVLSPRIASIKREFAMELPRPRQIDSPEMSAIKSQILKEFEEDFQFARREKPSSN